MAFVASLAVAGTSVAFAGTCTPPSSSKVECTGAFTQSITYPDVPDLTLALGPNGVPTSVVPAAGAIGVEVTSPGHIEITSSADITTEGASGIHTSGADSAKVTNSGTIDTRVAYAGANALDIRADGDVALANAGTADAHSTGVYDVTAIRAESAAVHVDNQASGVATATAADGYAIGIYAASTGDISVNNDGTVAATSAEGLADGIFAAGENVEVTNGETGRITAEGFDWASGVEAQSYDLTTVTNSGDISAVATANDETNQVYGQAFGIYASGGEAGIKASNRGRIAADGAYATGIEAESGGSITVDNSGAITLGASNALTTYYANGIEASNNYADSTIAIDNSGSIDATGAFGTYGISAVAGGLDSTAGITNTGSVRSVSEGSDYSNATGVLASGDAGASVRNSASGTIYTSGNYYAYGAQALTFNGDASVVNEGDVQAVSAGGVKYGGNKAYGVLAFSTNGTAQVTNTGSISATASGELPPVTRGIYAGGAAATVVNSGQVVASGGGSIGIDTYATTGDVTVLNRGSIDATAGKYSSAYGVVGSSIEGDVALANRSGGDIAVEGYTYAQGLRGVSFYGDVSIVNAGNVEVGAADPSDTFSQPNISGVYAGSRTGDVTVVNSGTILAQTYANGYGIETVSVGDGQTVVANSGAIQVIGQGVNVKGVKANSYAGGDLTISNSGTINTFTNAARSIGIYGYATGGDVSVSNEGVITATSDGNLPEGALAGPNALPHSWGEGIWIEHGANVEVSNSGSITALGFSVGAGIEAHGTGQVDVTNNGVISATATANDTTNQIYGQAFGVYATSGDGVSVSNSGVIDVTAPYTAIGVYAYAPGAEATVTNSGSIMASTEAGQAHGVFVSAGAVEVINSGSITADGYTRGAGIQASSDGDVNIDNSGSITAYGQSYAFGIYAQTANGLASSTNTADIHADSADDAAIGIYGGGVYGDVALDNTADGSIAAYSTNGTATALAGASYYGNVAVSNAGVLDAHTTHSDTAGSFAIGMIGNTFSVGGGDVVLMNATSGSISAIADNTAAKGMMALSYYGDVGIINAGDITASGSDAIGIYVFSVAGAAGIGNSGSIAADGFAGGTGIQALGTGRTTVSNSGAISATATANDTTNYIYGHAYGIYATGGDAGVDITNSGAIDATSSFNAIGIYGYAADGDVSVTNYGVVSATSTYGLADGIFAAGTNADVTNAGAIIANGFNWAAGIEAQSYDLTTVTNNGDISAVATANDEYTHVYGQAFGIYASGGEAGIKASNSGRIAVDGVFTTGIEAQSGGSITIANSGDITLGGSDALTTYYANGIEASNNYADSKIAIDNTGSIGATGAFGTYGISAVAGGLDSTAGITNTGSIRSVSEGSDYSTATGVLASGDAGASVRNGADGAIHTSGNYHAYGVQALTFNGDASVVNQGDVQAISAGGAKYNSAYGVLAFSTNGTAQVANNGSIYAAAYGLLPPTTRGIYAEGASANVVNSGQVVAVGGRSSGINTYATTGDVAVLNQGSIYATGKYAYGVVGFSTEGDVDLANSKSGDIAVVSSAYAYGLRGVSFYGDVALANAGNIELGSTSSDPSDVFSQPNATGMYAGSRTGDVTAVNSGTIIARTGANAYGITVLNVGDGTTSAVNSGDIEVIGSGANVKGINAEGLASSDLILANSGTIDASTHVHRAIGIYGSTQAGDISVNNTGTVTAFSGDAPDDAGAAGLRNSRGLGVWVQGTAGIDVNNGGSITAEGFALGIGVWAQGSGQTAVTNSGDISTSATANDTTNHIYGQAFGIYATGGAGGVSVANSDAIDATSSFTAVGIYGYAADGAVSITNRGTISATSTDGQANGIIASNRYHHGVNVDNRGTITADGYYASGIVAQDGGAGGVDINNRGEITANGYYASGVLAQDDDTGGVDIDNRGDITATGPYASGIQAQDNDTGEVSIDNRGEITATGPYASGVHAHDNGTGDVDISNRGVITAAGPYAFGVHAHDTGTGGVDISNRADIMATGPYATAVYALDDDTGGVGITNHGDITATGPYVIGIHAHDRGTGGVEVNNRGDITATGAYATGVYAHEEGPGSIDINNRGDIIASGPYAVAIHTREEGPGSVDINNRGVIRGAIVTHGGGDDTLVNQRHGTWQLTGTSTDFGAGDDRFTNAAGATLQMHDAAIAFGKGEDHIVNRGMITVFGHSAIDMTDGSAAAAKAALKRPKHIASFMNNGVISMLNGSADDSLTITGSFGGKGAINLDVSTANKRNDELFVRGGMLNGSKQHVNVMLLDGLPKASDVGTQLELVHVDAVTNPSVFKAGKVLGVSPRDFMDVGLKLSSTPVKHNADGTSYMLKVKTYVKGLNAAGVLASSSALAVDSLMSSTMGERSDRIYMTAPGSQRSMSSLLGLTPWVRKFSYKSGMNPDQVAGNFGQLANSHLTQNNYGAQMGLEYRLGNGFRFGTMFAKSEGRQYLVDGRGSDTIHGHTMGLYGTWVSPSGLYVDASWRSMQFRAHLVSLAGGQRSDGRAVGTKLELGQSWKLGNGLTVAPQLRYTETRVDGLSVQGYQATFNSRDTHWQRASAGVALQKTFASPSGWQWTPYGEANVVDTLNGVTDYAINQDYFGQVMSKGMSTQVKFGVGARKGKLSWNGGVNWLGGGNNVTGGFGAQMTLQYAW